MKISIYGSGYVGLVTGACLADAGHDIVCMDVDASRIERLEQGEMPIYEPGLQEIVEHNQAANRLRFTTDPAVAVGHGVLQFIAVGTPSDEDGSADLRYVEAVARQIGRLMTGHVVVVTKSTVPVGTAEIVRRCVAEELAARAASIEFDVASNPEFLKEGAAIDDFNRPDRIVVGTDSERVRRLMRACYAPFSRKTDKVMFMDITSAELTKYAANAMLATRISFMNEMAAIADKVGADVEMVRRGIGSDPRIGYDFIFPGCGYGGSCFPKDIRALMHFARGVGQEAAIIQAVERVNERQKSRLFEMLEQMLGGSLDGRSIALWGLAFKPNTDDMREAPSRALMEAVWAAGGSVRAYDPEAQRECLRIYGERDDLALVDSREAALVGADALAICTEWKEFLALDVDLFERSLTHKVVVDGRNLYDPDLLAGSGVRYACIGRPRT